MDNELIDAFREAIWSYATHRSMDRVYRDIGEGCRMRTLKVIQENKERIRDATVALYAERDKQAKLIVEGLQ